MSTVVFQGLQSCLEPQLVETRTLRLKLASPKPCHNEETNHMPSSNLELGGGWSFLQSLSQNPKQALDRETLYVHPMAKRSLSTLSDKSLELCTENLGSETGTDMTENTIFSLHKTDTRMGGGETPVREKPKSRPLLQGRKVNNNNNNSNSRDFPPPLTTMTGSSSLQVRPHRAGGRLIIEAIEAPSTHAYLQAERSHGRLRLCLWKDYCCDTTTTTFDSKMGSEENEEDTDMEEVIENEGNNEEKGDEHEEEEEEGFEEEFEEEDSEDEKGDVYEREDLEGNSLEVGVEMGMEKFQRPSRCNEGGRGNNKGLCNWEPFWVATS